MNFTHRLVAATALLALVAGAAVVEAGSGRAPELRRDTIELECPDWRFEVDAFGYSDVWFAKYMPNWYCLPGEHDVLSGEWAAAVYYDGIINGGGDPTAALRSAVWLSPAFILPTWMSNSSFTQVSLTAYDDPTNPADGGLGTSDTAQSIITNGQVNIQIDYEIAEIRPNLGSATPLGRGDGTFVRSSRRVLLVTYTVTNVSGGDLANVEFYQMLSGHPGNEYAAVITSVYDSDAHPDGYLDAYAPHDPVHATGDYHYDITQWNDPGHPKAEKPYIDWIGFASPVAPDAYDNNYYVGEFGKPPAPGTHWNIEGRNLGNVNLSFGEVAGGMQFNLGGLPDGNSTSVSVALMLGQDDCNGNGVTDICDIEGEGVGFPEPDAWDTLDPGIAAATGYAGGVYDGHQYIYFAPNLTTGPAANHRFLRYDTLADTWTQYNHPTAGGMVGVAYDEDRGYVYFAPYADGGPNQTFVRYNTSLSFTSGLAWDEYDPAGIPGGYMNPVYDGDRYVYFAPEGYTSPHGVVARFDATGSFTDPAAWESFDVEVAGIGTQNVGYRGAILDSRLGYIYFAPYSDGTIQHGEVLRFDINASGGFTDPTSWEAYDPGVQGGVGIHAVGFSGGTWDGRYVYFAPRYEPVAGFHGEVLRYDTQHPFDQAVGWETFDADAQGVGSHSIGYNDAVFDGRFVYFVPYSEMAGRHGEVLRYDTESDFGDVGAWAAYDYGDDPAGCGPDPNCTNPDGYWGAVLAEEYIYFVPYHNGNDFHNEVLRYNRSYGFFPDWNENGIPDVCDFGACCDTAGASPNCTDDVALDDCVGPDLRFGHSTLCADLDPQCGLGACCYDDGTPCDITDEATCLSDGGTFHLGELCEIACAVPSPCGSSPLYSNTPYTGDGAMTAHRKENSPTAYWAVDDVTFPGPQVTVQAVHWWVVADIGFNFADKADVIFLADDGGMPGAIVDAQYDLTCTRQYYGDSMWGLPIYMYEVTGLSTTLPAGTYWFGARPVQGASFDAHAFWMTAAWSPGDAQAFVDYTGGWRPGQDVYGVQHNLAFCITGTIPSPFGPCRLNPVFFASPPSGVVDARKPYPGDNANHLPLYGLGMPDDPATTRDETSPIVLDIGLQGIPASCFDVCEAPAQAQPNFVSEVVENGDGSYTIVLNHGLAPGAVTTVRYLGSVEPSHVVYYYHHPGNVDGSDAANQFDVLALIDLLNEALAGQDVPAWTVDIDYSGYATLSDLLELIDLLTGAREYDAWSGTALPVADGSCP